MPSNVIQWFPGHMAKTRRLIGENLKLVDMVIELLDARIPYSSENPEIDSLLGQKPTLSVLNKASLADPEVSQRWIAHYRARGKTCVVCDCVTGEGIADLTRAVRAMMKEKTDRWKERGIQEKHIRAMIVGIPNVGKSTFINRLAGEKKAKAENRPGVTLTKQWVTTDIGLDLLDMPGVLWPKFENQQVGRHLAMTGAIKDDVLQLEEIAMFLCAELKELAPEKLAARYGLSEADGFLSMDGYDLFMLIGQKRHLLQSGGGVNERRCADMLLDEFRSAKIGRISLETPKTNENSEKPEPKNDE